MPDPLPESFEFQHLGRQYRGSTVKQDDGFVHVWVCEISIEAHGAHSILATMAEGMAVHDAAGAIVENNPSAERILGLTRDQMRGRTSLDGTWQTIREDGSPYPGPEHPVERTLRTGEAYFGEVMGVCKPDGSVSWISINTQPLHGGALTTFSDITRQKAFEAELLSARGKLSALIESTPDPAWLVDLDFKLVVFNAALVKNLQGRYGLKVDAGYTPEQMFPTDTAAFARKSYQQCVDEGPYHMEYRAEDDKWYELHLHQVISGDKITGVSVFAKDITRRRTTLRALEESERRYRLISEHVADVVWTLDWDEQRITYISPSTFSLRGYRPEEVMNQRLDELLEPNSYARFQSAAAQRLAALAAGEESALDPLRLEVDMWRRDGSVVPTEIVLSILPKPDGLVEFVGVTRNITERRRAEAILRQREAELREAQRLAKIGNWTFDVSTSRLEWSEEIYRITGMDSSLAPLRTSELGAVYGAKGQAELQHAIQALLNREQRSCTLDMEITSLDGKQKWITLMAEAIPNEAGEVGRIRGTTQDVTERISVQRRLQSLAAAMQHTAELVLLLDADGRISYCNPAFEATTGWRLAEAVGQTPQILASGQHGPEKYEQMWRTAQAGAVWSGLITNRRKDGTLFDQESTISSIRDEAGRITGYVSVGRDITEKLNVENQLRQAQKLESIGLLAGGIAHDFNNLLTIVNGYSSLLLSRADLPEGVFHAVEQICEAGERAAGLTTQLLAFSRKQLLVSRPVDIQAFLKDSLGTLSRMAGHDIKVAISSASPQLVMADSSQLLQVLMNLVANSRDALPNGGRIQIEALPGPDQTVRLRVTDNGSGIDPSIQERIFDPFFTTKSHGAGSGLGLSMVYGIVRQLGGVVTVESTPGCGATFEITLPSLANSGPTPDSGVPARSPQRDEAVRGRGTVLVVEDGAEVRQLTVNILREYGYRVLEAASGDEALRIAGPPNIGIDLLLTDVMMPKMTGPEVAKRLRELRPGTSVLFMSGYTRDLISHDDVLDGHADYLAKPFTPEILARKVRDVLRNR